MLSTGKSRSDLHCNFFKTIFVLNREGMVKWTREEERELREKMMMAQTREALVEKTSGQIWNIFCSNIDGQIIDEEDKEKDS